MKPWQRKVLANLSDFTDQVLQEIVFRAKVEVERTERMILKAQAENRDALDWQNILLDEQDARDNNQDRA